MDRLTVLCFAGTYALALLAALAGFAAPRLRGGAERAAAIGRVAMIGLTTLGLAVHTAYLANLAIDRRGVPLTTAFESRLALAWVLAAIALYLLGRAGRPTAAGAVLLALVLAVLAVADLWTPRGEVLAGWPGPRSSRPAWLTFWGTVHGVFLTLGAVCTFLAFAFGLMYLAQSRRLKLKQLPGKGFALPSLEQSERWNRAAITLAFPLLTAGLLIGVVLVVASRRAGGMPLGWTDPKVLSTLALWLVFAALLHARYRPEWRGRRVMILTLVAFGLLTFSMLGVGLILPTAHVGLPGDEPNAADARTADAAGRSR
jgi:ABC-type transport system involved in cytochrome c biogenesis permease subunit